MRDERFAKGSASYLKPEHFTSAVDRNLTFVAQRFLRAHRAVPLPITLMGEIMAEPRIPPSDHPFYARRIAELQAIDLREREYIQSKVVDFCRNQALLLVALAIPDVLKTGDLREITKIKARTDAAFALGSKREAAFENYFEEAIKRHEYREKIAAGVVKPGVTTGFLEFDKHMYQGGYGRGELTVWMAPAKRGKTALMTQTALQSALRGKRWLYVSLEVSKEILGDRLDAQWADVDMDNLIDHRDHIVKLLESRRLAGIEGKFWIERRPANTFSTDDLDALIEAYFDTGRALDGYIVDYLGIMRLLGGSDKRFDGLALAGKELRRIAGKYDIAGVTAAQTNRDAVGKQLASMDLIGECFAIVQDCDLLISVNANESELAAGVRRLYWAASRNSPEVTIKVEGNMSKMRPVDRVIEVTH